MTALKPIYWNFDGLDVSFQGAIPPDMAEPLEKARLAAQANRSSELLEWHGEKMHVAESGARGGYAYRCDTGPIGATWFFSRNQSLIGWNIRVSVKSNALACLGLGKVRAELYRFLAAIGAKAASESISRVDYCMDFLASDIEAITGQCFALNPTAFVMHSHMSRMDIETEGDKRSHGVSGRYSSVTCGKMPGRQIIIYDKTQEISARRKPEWWQHWDAARIRHGHPPLTRQERVWRVEFRAGKEHLKNRWGITTWAQLDDKLGDLFAAAARQIRYTSPNANDAERFRWPNHPLWDAIENTIAYDLAEMMTGATPNAVKEIHRQQLAATMEQQLLGLLPGLTMSTGTPPDTESVSQATDALVRNYLETSPDRFQAGLERSARKYRLICD